tara:strand:- start:2381 stop:2668 length:288 start_codon:yes stop_codon:yes gene_type:complete
MLCRYGYRRFLTSKSTPVIIKNIQQNIEQNIDNKDLINKLRLNENIKYPDLDEDVKKEIYNKQLKLLEDINKKRSKNDKKEPDYSSLEDPIRDIY